MIATPLAFPSGGLRLDGVLHRPSGPASGLRGGVVVCHPHPQYGGTMDNSVVLGLAEALCRQGLAALRFDFRGVGRSEGRHGGGGPEVGDVGAALDALAGCAGIDPARVGVAGYSFGAWVGLRAGREDPRVVALVAVAPPFVLSPLEFMAGCPKPVLAVAGDRDAYCPTAALERWVSSIGDAATRVILGGTDHFLAGREDEVGRLAAQFLERRLSAPQVPSPAP